MQHQPSTFTENSKATRGERLYFLDHFSTITNFIIFLLEKLFLLPLDKNDYSSRDLRKHKLALLDFHRNLYYLSYGIRRRQSR